MANGSTQTNVSSDPELELMRQKLAILEKQMADKDAELAEMREQANSGLKVLASASAPYVGPDGGYLFEVKPRNPAKYPHLKPLRQRACDESEIKRYYYAVNEEVKGSNKRLDAVKCQLIVTCLEKSKRNEKKLFKAKLANIRKRLDDGHMVSKEDQELIDFEYERSQEI